MSDRVKLQIWEDKLAHIQIRVKSNPQIGEKRTVEQLQELYSAKNQ